SHGAQARAERLLAMAANKADALVLFGATGDLAHRKIFPALQSLVQRGTLDVPLVGVARSGWNLEKLKERMGDSLEHSADGLDDHAFQKLVSLLRYVDGDYRDESTFTRLREALDTSEHPLHYLALPPSLFATVSDNLRE